MAQIELKPLPPREAIEYFRGKGFATSFAWQDVWEAEHARAFTVAKAMRVDILQDIRDAVERALVNGTTLATFQKELEPILRAKGWWGKQRMVDPATGEERLVQLGSPRRLETIFRVNLRTAYAVGKWKDIQRSKKSFPYLRYTAVMDERTRPQHRAWHGTILPVDDPWWDEHYPPCGWNCRCTIRQMTPGMVEREGQQATETPISFPKKRYTNPRTGEHVQIEEGIDPGWAYNVGKAALEDLTPPPLSTPPAPEPPPAAPAAEPPDLPAAPSLPEPHPEAADTLLDEGASRAEQERALLDSLGVAGDATELVTDGAGETFPAGPALLNDSAGRAVAVRRELVPVLPLVGRTIREPDEVWLVWQAGERPGTSRLVRRYVRTQVIEGEFVAIVVDVAKDGWSATSSRDPGFELHALRTGWLHWWLAKGAVDDAGQALAESDPTRP